MFHVFYCSLAGGTPLQRHYIDLARVPWVPQRGENFQFLKSQTEIKGIRCVIFPVATHLDRLYLQKGIPLFFGKVSCRFKEFSSDSSMMVFFQYAHYAQFQGIPSGFLQS